MYKNCYMSLADNYCLVALGKDPSLIAALTSFAGDPSLIVTTNGVFCRSQGERDRQVAFNEFAGDRLRNFPLSDAGLQALVSTSDFPNPLEGGFMEDLRWDASITSFRNEVKLRINQVSKGRPVAVNTYSNSSHSLGLGEMGYLVLGPKPELVERFSNKLDNYDVAVQLGIPVVEGEVAGSLIEAADLLSKYGTVWDDGAFVTSEKGSGGKTARHIRDPEELEGFAGKPPLLLTRWVEKQESPNSLVLIGKDRAVYLGVTDQIILRGVEYFGNLFPSQVGEMAQERIKSYSERFANHMRGTGYRGFVGFDWIVTMDGEVFFSETNARKNRSTSMLVAALEANRPEEMPTLSEMEVLATLEEPLGEVDSWDPARGTYWGMRLFKTFGRAEVTRKIIPEFDDRTIFSSYLEGSRSSVLNFPDIGTVLERFKTYHDLARIITVGSSRDEVIERIEGERSRIKGSYEKVD